MSKAFTREETDGPDIPELPPLASSASGRREELYYSQGHAVFAR